MDYFFLLQEKHIVQKLKTIKVITAFYENQNVELDALDAVYNHPQNIYISKGRSILKSYESNNQLTVSVECDEEEYPIYNNKIINTFL